MSRFRSWACAAVLATATATASPAFAQLTGTTGGATGTTSGTSTGGISSGGRAPTGTNTGSNSFGSGSSGSSGGAGSGSFGNGTTLTTQQFMSDPTAPTGTASSSLNKSNFLAGYYSNPSYMGLLSNNQGKTSAPGGFGSALYGTTTTGTGAISGGRGGTSSLTSGGIGGRQTGQNSNQSGILIPLPVQIAYTAQMQFPAPPVASPKLQADLRGIIGAGGLSAPQSVQVVITGTNVTLRGTVKDDDEKRLVEGLVRTTPGVGLITNELTYPVATK